MSEEKVPYLTTMPGGTDEPVPITEELAEQLRAMHTAQHAAAQAAQSAAAPDNARPIAVIEVQPAIGRLVQYRLDFGRGKGEWRAAIITEVDNAHQVSLNVQCVPRDNSGPVIMRSRVRHGERWGEWRWPPRDEALQGAGQVIEVLVNPAGDGAGEAPMGGSEDVDVAWRKKEEVPS